LASDRRQKGDILGNEKSTVAANSGGIKIPDESEIVWSSGLFARFHSIQSLTVIVESTATIAARYGGMAAILGDAIPEGE
jgi:hypothetical protein